MNVVKVIEELRAYRAQIEEAITALESLARRRGKRRGRPPKWLASQPRKRREFSAATKKKMAAAQRKRWALVRKTAKSS